MKYSQDPFGMYPVWCAILSIFDVFSKICKENGLTYYVGYGTLIGAVRHKGFIPWDDDLDVMMPRKDYRKFLEIAPKVLPAHLKHVFWGNTPEFIPYAFCKIQETRKSIVKSVEEAYGHALPHGLYVDIFPLDGAPKTFLEKVRFYYNVVALYSARSSFYGIRKSPDIIKFIWRGIGWLFARYKYRAYNVEDIYWRYDVLSMMFPFCKDRRCGCVQTPLGGKVLYGLCDYSDFGTPVELEFCGRRVSAPSNYRAFLKCRYGDYMKLPPVEERIPSHGNYIKEAPWKYGPTKV